MTRGYQVGIIMSYSQSLMVLTSFSVNLGNYAVNTIYFLVIG